MSVFERIVVVVAMVGVKNRAFAHFTSEFMNYIMINEDSKSDFRRAKTTNPEKNFVLSTT